MLERARRVSKLFGHQTLTYSTAFENPVSYLRRATSNENVSMPLNRMLESTIDKTQVGLLVIVFHIVTSFHFKAKSNRAKICSLAKYLAWSKRFAQRRSSAVGGMVVDCCNFRNAYPAPSTEKQTSSTLSSCISTRAVLRYPINILSR